MTTLPEQSPAPVSLRHRLEYLAVLGVRLAVRPMPRRWLTSWGDLRPIRSFGWTSPRNSVWIVIRSQRTHPVLRRK